MLYGSNLENAELNRVSVSTDRCLLKSDFSTGDKVVIRFQRKNFSGVGPVPNRDFTASTKSVQPPVSVTAAATNSPVTKKRKRG